MKKTSRLLFTTVVLILTLMTNLAIPVPAFADEGTPQTPPTEEPVVAETQAPETIVEELSSSIETTEQPVLEPDSVSELLDQLPENTNLIVLNEDGKVEPLVTEEAANTIVTGDPMWCPDGATPNTDVNGDCTISHSSFDDLIADLTTNSGVYYGSGTIYISYDYTVAGSGGDTGDIIFDYGSVSLTNLTLQGGWDFSNDTVTGTTTINGANSLRFWDWGGYGIPGDLTLQDINLEGGTGLYLGGYSDSPTANIILNNVNVSNTDYGAFVMTLGNIQIIDSTFNDNIRVGLDAESAGDITLSGIQVSNNGSGAYLDNTHGVGDINVIGTNTFNNNSDGAGNGYGLIGFSSGEINLNNITASNNAQFGTFLESNSGSGNIIFTGNNSFNNNGWGGINAVSGGDIFLENVTATNNNGSGLELGTNAGDITITCGLINGNIGDGIAAGLPGTLTLNGVIFNGNTAGDVTIFGNGTVLQYPFDCNSIKNNGEVDKPYTGFYSGLPLQIAGSNADLDCNFFSGTVLILSNGDKIIFKCPIGGSASLSILPSENLPGLLPENMVLISGMQANQSPEGSHVALGGLVIVSFIIPEELVSANLSILYWNGSEWIDLNAASFEDGRQVFNGGSLTSDGYFEAITNFSGSFVLVKK